VCSLLVRCDGCPGDLNQGVKRPWFKLKQKVVEFYAQWDSDAEVQTDRLFGGPLGAAGVEYSPNDSTPWTWDLKSRLFTMDLDWDDLLVKLRQRDPAED